MASPAKTQTTKLPPQLRVVFDEALHLAGLGKRVEAVQLLDRALGDPPQPSELLALRALLVRESLDALRDAGDISWDGGKPSAEMPTVAINAGPPLAEWVAENRV